MNIVFTVVKELPKRELLSEECVIKRLDFVDEVAACERKRGGSHVLGVNYLRAVAEEVGKRYDKNFNAYRRVIPSDYAGIQCYSIEEIAKVVATMFDRSYPQIYDKYLEYKIKTAPYNAKVIYYLGEQSETEIFNQLGIEMILPESVDDYLRTSNVAVEAPKLEIEALTQDTAIEQIPVEVISEPIKDSELTLLQEPQQLDTSSLLDVLAKDDQPKEGTKHKSKNKQKDKTK